jgi:hypothetical protein
MSFSERRLLKVSETRSHPKLVPRWLVAASAIAGMRNIDVPNARAQKSATATFLKLFLWTQYLHFWQKGLGLGFA